MSNVDLNDLDIVSDEEESKIAEEWIHWCKKQGNVKCTESSVPQGILPKGYYGTLIDVKVQGKKRCPDDKLYSQDAQLRDKVARGNCVLELKSTDNGIRITNYVFLIFALRKFSGGMGDEDEDSESCQNLWQKYFLKSIDLADKVVVTAKANGEAGHLSCRKIAGQTLYCLGSKNVHLLVRNQDDLRYYSDSRYDTARVVAKSFFSTYLENPSTIESRESLVSYLQQTKYTAVMEVLQPAYQHIEDLSYLSQPELRFICWTAMYSELDSDSLCSVAPNTGIDIARNFGLSTISYEVIQPTEAEEYMMKIRRESGYEGKVLYFLDSNENVFGLIKKKTAWYIILRALREKACSFSSQKAVNSNSEMETKVIKRLAAIQIWLGFSNTYRLAWQKLGVAFVQWLVQKSRKDSGKGAAVRAKFPQLFKEFLEKHSDLEDLYINMVYS